MTFEFDIHIWLDFKERGLYTNVYIYIYVYNSSHLLLACTQMYIYIYIYIYNSSHLLLAVVILVHSKVHAQHYVFHIHIDILRYQHFCFFLKLI